MSWPWLMAAWRVADPECRPAAILVYEGERLLAAAAFQRRKTRYYRVPFSEVSFLGDGLSDQQEFLCRPEHPTAVAQIWRVLAGNPWHAELLRLEHIPDTSATLAAGLDLLPGLQVESASAVCTMAIQGAWDDYLRNVQWELRRDLRKSERRLSEAGDWRIRHVQGKQIEALLPDLRTIEMAGYKGEENKAFLANSRNGAFVSAYLEVAPDDDTVLTLLEVNERIAAYLLGFVQGDAFYAFNTSFDEAFRKSGPGKYVYARSIRYAFDRSLGIMNFGSGKSHLKDRLGGKPAANSRAVYFYPGLKGSAVRLAVFHVRPWLQTLMHSKEMSPDRQT